MGQNPWFSIERSALVSPYLYPVDFSLAKLILGG